MFYVLSFNLKYLPYSTVLTIKKEKLFMLNPKYKKFPPPPYPWRHSSGSYSYSIDSHLLHVKTMIFFSAVIIAVVSDLYFPIYYV